VRRSGLVLAVAVGGALGTVARYELALAEPVRSGAFPWATFIANVVGSLLLGIVLACLVDGRPAHETGRALLGVGFCGGLTTFSTWMVESVLLTRDGDGGRAALYLVVTLVAGFAAVAMGAAVARAVTRRPALPPFDPQVDD
jgi:CrcB protein